MENCVLLVANRQKSSVMLRLPIPPAKMLSKKFITVYFYHCFIQSLKFIVRTKYTCNTPSCGLPKCSKWSRDSTVA